MLNFVDSSLLSYYLKDFVTRGLLFLFSQKGAIITIILIYTAKLELLCITYLCACARVRVNGVSSLKMAIQEILIGVFRNMLHLKIL